MSGLLPPLSSRTSTMSHPTCCCSVSLDRCDRCDLLVGANPSANAAGLKGDSPPMNATTKRLTRNIGRKYSLRVRPQKARWRARSVRTSVNALAAFAPPRVTSSKSQIGSGIKLKALYPNRVPMGSRV